MVGESCGDSKPNVMDSEPSWVAKNAIKLVLRFQPSLRRHARVLCKLVRITNACFDQPQPVSHLVGRPAALIFPVRFQTYDLLRAGEQVRDHFAVQSLKEFGPFGVITGIFLDEAFLAHCRPSAQKDLRAVSSSPA